MIDRMIKTNIDRDYKHETAAINDVSTVVLQYIPSGFVPQGFQNTVHNVFNTLSNNEKALFLFVSLVSTIIGRELNWFNVAAGTQRAGQTTSVEPLIQLHNVVFSLCDIFKMSNFPHWTVSMVLMRITAMILSVEVMGLVVNSRNELSQDKDVKLVVVVRRDDHLLRRKN